MKANRISRTETLLFIFVSFAAYWFANATLWIPWVINQWFGIACMILLVPVLWGASSYYCLVRTSLTNWKMASFALATIFLVVAVISDFFFFAIWRGIPDELYHPTTFAAYALIVIMPFIICAVLKRKRRESKPINSKALIIAGGLGIIFLISTLYSMRYW